jgi:hypothetical protein
MTPPRKDAIGRDNVEIVGEVRAITELAILLDDGDQQVWLPRSRFTTDDDLEIDALVTLEVEEWLALDKGLT